MKTTLRSLAIALFLSLGLAPLHAQLATKTTLSLELAKKIAAKAEAFSAEKKWNVVVAIVDDGGNLILLQRMDGTQLGSLEVATGKAKTALRFKRPTKAFEDAVAGGRQVVLSIPDAVLIEGGVPLTVNGAIVGAIGISGMTSAQDGEIAAAALTVLAQP